jgi:hypothetical protein
MLYAYGATVVEIVRRKEFGEYDIKPAARIVRDAELLVSAVLLPTSAKHLGSHGEDVVCVFIIAHTSDKVHHRSQGE